MVSEINGKLTTQQLVKANKKDITDALGVGFTGDWWIPLTNDPVMREAFPCHDIIMSTSFYLQSKGHTELVDVIQYNKNRS